MTPIGKLFLSPVFIAEQLEYKLSILDDALKKTVHSSHLLNIFNQILMFTVLNFRLQNGP